MSTAVHGNQMEADELHAATRKTLVDWKEKERFVPTDDDVGSFLFQRDTGIVYYLQAQALGVPTLLQLTGQTGHTIVWGNSNVGSTTATQFLTVPTNGSPATASSAATKIPAGVAGNVTRLEFSLESASTADIAFTLRLNGSDTALTGTLTAGGTALTVTGSIAVTERDLLEFKIVCSASDAGTRLPHGAILIV